jgi:flavin reductase (DIM6/NTAB) family NADH-FMN oxidoreductase RutF
LPATAVTGELLREVAGLFATGVTVVTARDPHAAQPHGMTANAFMSVSLEPPLVVVSVSRAARLHHVVGIARSYGVTVLGADLEREARRFAGLPVPDRTSPPEFGERAGVPVLPGGLAWLVADVTATHRAGDHTLFVGLVRDAALENPEQEPLGFHRSLFGRFVAEEGAAPTPLDVWSSSGDFWG